MVKKSGANVKKKIKRSARSLVVKQLENVSKDVFKKYYSLITELVGNSPGIYALYDETELYYVGKSTDLRKRVKQHLRDRHLANWTRFSLYLVRKVAHTSEIESLLVRVANPKGNRVVPKGKSSGAMLKQLKATVKQKQKEEFEKMFGKKRKKGSKQVKEYGGAAKKSLKGVVTYTKVLYRAYKGKEYKAKLKPNGTIKLGNKVYASPTAAAKAVTKRKSGINGRTFWNIRNQAGEWVKLGEYKA